MSQISHLKPLHMSALAVAVTALITACGGSSNTASNPSAITLSGTAATGAPMAGATVVVKDSTGAEVQSCAPCTVDSNGGFSVELKTAAKAPFVLLVSQDGSDEPQVSMIDTALSAHVNVSPITTLIAARLSPSGDPAQLTAADSSAAKITTATTDIKTALQPLLEAAGLSADANPLTMTFKADSTGLDKALDILGKPTIVRTSDGKASVEIEIKTSGSDEAEDAAGIAAKISLTAGAAPVSTGITLAKMRTTLPADGVNIKIKGLTQRMQDCYAIAPAQRRSSGATFASQITAASCKAIFVDDDPGKYLNNNTVVSQSGSTLPTEANGRFTGAFSGIFGTVQGLQFDLPEYRYTVKNGNTTIATKSMEGDVVFTARWTVTDPNAGANLGQSDVSEYHARLQNGELKLIGNQSNHDLYINAQARREEMPAVADYAYLSTGYNIGISERRWTYNGSKVSIYEQVVVTSPSGKEFTFKPIADNNYDYLGLVNSAGNTTSTATVRLNGVYLNSSTTGHPSERFTKAFWGDKTVWTEDAIKAIPAQGNWKFDITLTDAFVTANASKGTTKKFTQYRRAINRAPTLAELQATKWPTLKDPVKTTLSTQATSQGFVTISTGGVAASLGIDGWDVPTGTWAPTNAKVYGSGWDEGGSIASTARKATIRCTGSGAQCEKTAGTTTNTGKFLNTSYNYLQLTGRDAKRLQMSLNYSTRTKNAD